MVHKIHVCCTILWHFTVFVGPCSLEGLPFDLFKLHASFMLSGIWPAFVRWQRGRQGREERRGMYWMLANNCNVVWLCSFLFLGKRKLISLTIFLSCAHWSLLSLNIPDQCIDPVYYLSSLICNVQEESSDLREQVVGILFSEGKPLTQLQKQVQWSMSDECSPPVLYLES